MIPLTTAQLDVLVFMWNFYCTNDQLPPMAKVSEFFGWGSVNAAQEHKELLMKKGALMKNQIGKYKFTPEARAALELMQ